MKRLTIEQEIAREKALTAADAIALARSGDTVRAAGSLLFHTDPARAEARLAELAVGIERSLPGDGPAEREAALRFLFRVAVDLRSFLPQWSLAKGLSEARVEEMAARALQALRSGERAAPEAAAAVLAALRASTRARLTAEAAGGPQEIEAEASRLVGGSLADAAGGLAEEISRSNLLEVARGRFRGATTTEFGNDYAAFLQDVIWRGGSFVTTNPVLIKVAWDTDPALWNRRVDGLILGRHDRAAIARLLRGPVHELEAAVSGINSIVTMAVVLENCRLLRGIFLASGGREGYVSLQVNPRLHDDAARMAEEAKALHRELEAQIGGVPNVVFKLPSTAAGLEAARTLGAAGIGVTITLTFSVAQADAFARVLRESRAPVSYIAIMNGRMAFPVRDELQALGVKGGAEAARWAGVEVARKACRRLYGSPADGGLGVDPSRVKIMIASLRIYDDWLPDISELWGVPLITIFPNVRRVYDGHRRPFDGSALRGETPADSLELMSRSEIFRQASWLPGEASPPAQPLSLEPRDARALAAWPPMAQTLKSFIELYDQMGAMVRGRLQELAGARG